MRAAFSFKMAYRHVRASFARVALSVLAVGLGVSLVVAIRLMNTAVLESFLSAVDAVSGRAALSITAPDGANFPEELIKKVAGVRGIKLAVPLVSGVAFPDDGSGELLTVHGVDFTHDAEVRLYQDVDDASQVVEDTLLFLNDPHSIVLTRQFAEQRGLEIGQTIPLVTPTGVQSFTIRGLLEPHGLARALGGRLVVMDLYAAQRAFAADGRINQIDVVLDREVDFDATRAALAELLPAGLEIREPAVRRDVVRGSIAAFQSMLTAFGLLAVFAGFVICYTRLTAVFEARSWEIGLLRAGGLRRSVVFRELLKESLLLGAAGAAIGIPLGVVVAKIGLPFLATTTALASGFPVPDTQVSVQAPDVLVGIVLGLAAAAAAALSPALRTARTNPVAALTMRGRELAGTISNSRSRGPLVVTILIVGSVFLQRVSGVREVGFVTTALIVLAGCLFARPLVGYGAEQLKTPWNLWFGPSGRMAVGHLARHPRGTALLVTTLGIGLGSVLMLGTLGWSFESTLVSTLSRFYRAQIVISSAFASGGYRNAPMADSVVRAIRQVPGVAVSVGEQERDTRVGDESILINASDAECFLDRRICDWPIDEGDPDALQRVADGQAVAVSRAFAYLHGTRPGGEVVLSTPGGPHRFLVVATTSAQPASAVFMSRDLYRRLWNDDFVSWVHVVPTEGIDAQVVAATIGKDLGPTHRLRILDNAALIDHFADQVRQAFSLQYVMGGITLLLVLIAIGDTLAAAVAARTREIGMMRAVGLHRASVFRIVLLEAAAIAVLGMLLAYALGLTLGVFWVDVQFPAVLGWNLDLHAPYGSMFAIAIITLVLCLVGAFLPSLRAARLSVPAALRTE